ncbi:MAG: hypothetical protein NT051_03530 [Candidatus Micrarchaeota archaeon]|nr:hypothetical protein [Candidatus Micrarchaeota archaeon]
MTIGRQYTPNLTRQRTDVHAQIATLLKKLDDPVVKNKLAIKEPDSGLGIVKVLDGKTLRTNLIKIRAEAPRCEPRGHKGHHAHFTWIRQSHRRGEGVLKVQVGLVQGKKKEK